MKLHVSLDVKDINQSLNFYRTLFAVEPTKVKPGYAKFDLASPPVVLTLNETQGCCDRICGLNHMGVRVESTAARCASAVPMPPASLSAALSASSVGLNGNSAEITRITS